VVIIIGIPDHRNLARARKIFCFFEVMKLSCINPSANPLENGDSLVCEFPRS
jgi:hypothetical protein